MAEDKELARQVEHQTVAKMLDGQEYDKLYPGNKIKGDWSKSIALHEHQRAEKAKKRAAMKKGPATQRVKATTPSGRVKGN